jgi:anti-sigma B factor antagonist
MPNDPFFFEDITGQHPTTRILRLKGPLVLQAMFQFQEELSKYHQPLTIFDLAEVPYMDSAGIGIIINYYVSATKRGHKVIVVGTTTRVFELFKLTHVDTIIPQAASVEEAESKHHH